MPLLIRPIRLEEIGEARRLLLAGGWSGVRMEPAHLEILIRNARDAVVALDGERVVGFARALGDGVFNGYLSMLVVDEARRGEGIGRALVEHVMGSNLDMTWVLRARPEVQGFYESIGFARSTVAMERVRRDAGPNSTEE